MTSGQMQRKTTTCHKCTGFCPLVVTVENGRAIKIEGDLDAPLYKGFTCPKGRALGAENDSLKRLTHSLKRMPDGRFEPISSDQLIEELAERVSQILDASGPNAIAAFPGMPMSDQTAAGMILPAFMGAIGSPMMFSNGTLDQPGVQIAPALHGTWDGGRTHPELFDTLLLVGRTRSSPSSISRKTPASSSRTWSSTV
jgi:anaerobic selenocysteine-containing dehydrogenase